MLIPTDILVEILLRLPAKSLLRLRWTCKYWFDLISRDSSFVKMHLHHSTAHNEIFSIISPSLLSASDYGDRNKIFQCYLNYNNTTRVGDGSSAVHIDLPFDYSIGCRSEIMGSCNGLILIYLSLSNNLCIWNLCTKEYKVLPDPLHIQGVYVSEVYNYGFGYDHTNDDYKVIRNRCYQVGYDELDLYSDVQVYTLSTNSWRRIGPNPYKLRDCHPTQGVFLNGVLYWMNCSGNSIISFDFETEKFQHVSTIRNISGRDEFSYVRIRVFEGYLCVVLNIIDQPYYCEEIWLMNDYAVNNNNNNKSVWTKGFAVPNLCLIEPLRCTRNGDILMLSNKRDLVLFDQKSNNAKILCKNICKGDSHHVIQVYTESLVSLNSGTYKGQEEEDDGVEETIFSKSFRYTKRSV